MTLTMPRAGTDPGRAAQVRAETPQSGADIAAFGRNVQGLFEQVEQFQLDTELEQAQTDATRQLNDLRLEVEQIGDPDAAGQRWTAGAEEIRNSYVGADTGGLAPKNRDRFGRSFQRLENAHAFSLGQRLLRDRFAQREASYMDYAYEAARQGATADPKTREVLIAQGDERIDAMIASGVIDAAKGQALKIGLRGDIDGARAIDMVNNDPDGFLDASSDAANFPGLSAEQLAQRRAQAQTEIDRRQSALQRTAEAEARERDRVIGVEISDAVTVLKSGKPYGDTDFLDEPATKAHKDYPELAAWLRLQKRMPGLGQMPPTELWSEIKRQRAKPAKDAHETEELKALERFYDEGLTGWNSDPYRLARDRGFTVPELPEFDPANPNAFLGALQRRTAFAEWMNDEGYTSDLQVFDPTDVERIKELADVETDPSTRAELARIAASTRASDGTYPLQKLIDDPVSAHVGGYLAGGGRSDLATEILKGQRNLKLGNVIGEKEKDILEEAFSEIGDLFVDVPAGDIAEASAREAAIALYAARKRRTGPTEEFDEGTFSKAVNEVLGYQGGTGGIQNVRRRKTILPLGMSADTAERTLENVGIAYSEKQLPRGRSQIVETPDQGVFVEQMKAASGGHRPVYRTGEDVSLEDLADFKIMAVGDDRYVFTFGSEGGRVAIYDERREPFQFSLRRLSQEVGR